VNEATAIDQAVASLERTTLDIQFTAQKKRCRVVFMRQRMGILARYY